MLNKFLNKKIKFGTSLTVLALVLVAGIASALPGDSITAVIHPGSGIQAINTLRVGSDTSSPSIGASFEAHTGSNKSFIDFGFNTDTTRFISSIGASSLFGGGYLNLGLSNFDLPGPWTQHGNLIQRVNVSGNVLSTELNQSAGNISGGDNVCVDGYGRLKLCDPTEYAWVIGDWGACSDGSAGVCSGSYPVNNGGTCSGSWAETVATSGSEQKVDPDGNPFNWTEGMRYQIDDLDPVPSGSDVLDVATNCDSLPNSLVNSGVISSNTLWVYWYEVSCTSGSNCTWQRWRGRLEDESGFDDDTCFGPAYGDEFVSNEGPGYSSTSTPGSCSGTYQTTSPGSCSGTYDFNDDTSYGCGGPCGGCAPYPCDGLSQSQCGDDPEGLNNNPFSQYQEYCGPNTCTWTSGATTDNSCAGLSQSICTSQAYSGCSWVPNSTSTTHSCSGANTESSCNALNSACGWADNTSAQSCSGASSESSCTAQNSACTWSSGSESIKTRIVTCQDTNGNVVSDSNCPQPKPAETSTEGCGLNQTYSWDIGSWGACTSNGGGSCSGTYTTGIISSSVKIDNDGDPFSWEYGYVYRDNGSILQTFQICQSDLSVGDVTAAGFGNSNQDQLGIGNPNNTEDCITSIPYSSEWHEQDYFQVNQNSPDPDHWFRIRFNSSGAVISKTQIYPGDAYGSSGSGGTNTHSCSGLNETSCGFHSTCNWAIAGSSQTRSVTCRRDSDGQAVDDLNCSQPKPAESQSGCLTAIDGVCNNQIRNGCLSGIANDAAYADTSSQWRWRCDGQNSGVSSPMCSRAKEVSQAVNGVCGDLINRCVAGTFYDPDPSTLNWTCQGQNGGSTANCNTTINIDLSPILGWSAT